MWRNVRQRRLKVFRRPRKGFAASQIEYKYNDFDYYLYIFR
ncbi:hypothetical protein MCC93_21270 [Morococcus cerebrosus]|uniref:Uncharacterized protein n=1 Tax=Morococcus cerebrosus TaxID=1056807 RepID=A0A0C1GII4_9NEIS|nr:hypothetical protein MCC93_21270 [Morococcus cerebrosus]